MPSLADMSDDKPQAPTLVLNELSINGKNGKFVIKKKLAGLKKKDANDKFGRYDKEEIDGEVDVVFLKVRRVLKLWRRDKQELRTNEHTSKFDTVVLFGDDKVVKDKVENIRAKYDKLRVQLIVYALYNGELVRLLVKGASIGSTSKAESTPGFYDYLKEFKSGGNDEHYYQFKTRLKPIEEVSSLGAYYCMTYEKGDKLTEEEMKLVEQKMTIAYNHINEVNKYYGTQSKNADDYKKDGSDDVEEPDDAEIAETTVDEIDPNDIPF